MADDAETSSLLADLRRVCALLRDQFNPASRELGLLMERLRNPDLGPLKHDLCYHVEQWDNETIIRVIAACGNFSVALGAYEAAVKTSPRSRWLLRDGARACKEYVPINGSD